MEELKYIGVQFMPVGKHYHFSISPELNVQLGDYVVVNTSRGVQLALVAALDVDPKGDGSNVLNVERVANQEDLEIYQANKEKSKEAVIIVNRFLKENNYGDIKAVDTEYTLDGAKMTIYMTYEQDVEFDIRSFLRDVSKNFSDTRLEVRQVGPRDVAKMVSGLGACGMEKRCCSRFLTEFSSISIKMAKAQDISLTPSEITGICGRLRCCLRYESETYEAALKELPKRKKMVMTPLGEGRVTQVLPLSQSVIVNLPEIGPRQFTREELETGVMQVKPVVFEEDQWEYELDHTDVELLKIEPEPQHRGKRPSGRAKRDSDRVDRSGRDKPRKESAQAQQDKPKRGISGGRVSKTDNRGKKDKQSPKSSATDAKQGRKPGKPRGKKPSRGQRQQKQDR
ncbi:MAG: stage 0 sporulation protein [Chloroflexi bacterium]|nr:stage 0 sporulation protein [Chloroflexota bacterium]